MLKTEEKEKVINKEIYEFLKGEIKLDTHSNYLESFYQSFVAKDAVSCLLKHSTIQNREVAIEKLNKLIESDYIRHVTYPKKLDENNDFFYIVEILDFRGTLGKTSWKVNDCFPKNEDFVDMSPMDKHNIKLLNNVHPKTWNNPRKTNYELLVIGAGAGGLISTIQAAGLGIRVAIIEEYFFGGDCLNTGCVPSKSLLKCAKVFRNLKQVDKYGITIDGEVSIDFGKIMERMRKIRKDISPADSFERYSKIGASVFKGTASFESNNTVKVKSGNEECTLKFERCIIATGGRAFIPDIVGLKTIEYLTNSTIFNLTELPKTMAIIGSGPIGIEMAQAFSSFGTVVHVFVRSNKILSKEDTEASTILYNELKKANVNFYFHSTITKVEKEEENIKILYKTDKENVELTLICSKILVATGRIPNIEKLNLEKANVKYNIKGVSVNDKLQTNNNKIYAVGDVCCKYKFTHIADATAKIAFRNAMIPLARYKLSSLVVPWCTYTSPEIAHVGKTENELIFNKVKYRSFKTTFEHNDRVKTDENQSKNGFIKLIVADKTDKILGCSIVSENAGDLISEVTTAITNNIGAIALSNVIHPYPTEADTIRICSSQVNKQKLTDSAKWKLRNLIRINLRISG